MTIHPRTAIRNGVIGVLAAGTAFGLAPAAAGAATASPGGQAAQLTDVVQRPNPNPVLVRYYEQGNWSALASQARVLARFAHGQAKVTFTALARTADQLARQDAALTRAVNAIRVPHPLLSQYLAQHRYGALAQQADRLAQATRNPALRHQYQQVAALARQAAFSQNQIAFTLIKLGNRVPLR